MKIKTVTLLPFSVLSLALLVLPCARLDAQTANVPAPITQARVTQARSIQALDEKNLVVLKGNVHPLARAEFDQGAVSDGQPLHRMLLLLQRGADQEAALQQLLDDQQNKSSSNYHAWLTPAQFGQQFGPADADIQTVANWLQSHGFQVTNITAGRTTIEFSGSAAQVRSAFHTEIHKYLVNGETRLANASDPQIPAALAPVVAGPVSLNNFPPKSHMRHIGTFQKSVKTGETKPLFTFPGCAQSCYGLGPADFAAIYNTAPLLSGTPKIDGTGQTIAIVGESDINVQDVIAFRNIFGLPQNFSSSNIIVNGPDPGFNDSESESDLDVQWSGAVAPGATIQFVTSQPTETTAGIFLSAIYIVENNLAGVMSESFGGCEQQIGTLNQFHSSLWEQAAAQGITVMVSAGDGGSAGCDDFDTAQTASHGLAVSGFASTPFNVAVGGTDFDQLNNWTPYWSTTNTSMTEASALGYIPEIPWNDSCGQLGLTGCGASAPQRSLNIVAGSGGVSTVYQKPSWQSGLGVPLDSHRDVPDVSLFASNGFNSSFYIYCRIDVTTIGGSCNLSEFLYTFQGAGGTSVSTPAFAGILALVNQKQATAQNPTPRQGNANYILYQLFKKQTNSTPPLNCNSSAVPASGCTFNDITRGNSALANSSVGNNDVPCSGETTNCSSKTAGTNGVLVTTASPSTPAYSTTTGYDLATGLGSVNAANLVNNWGSVTFLPSTTTLSATLNGNPVNPIGGISHGTALNVSSTVAAGQGASGTPTGQIALMATPNPTPGSTSANLGIEALTLGANGSAMGTGMILPGGQYTLTAHYPGDGTFGTSDSAGIPVNITPEASKTLISIPVFNASTGAETGNSPASLVYGSPYIARIDVGNSHAALSFPAQPVCTAPACPTGTITWTDSFNAGATALDGGTFALNSSGFTEDQPIELAGGSHVLSASYSGDSSYSASSSTYAVTVAPAPTVTTIDTVDNVTIGTVGAPFGLNLTVRTQSSGAIPTGTYTVYDGGKAVNGVGGVSGGQTGSFSTTGAFAQGGLTFTFTTPGTHVLTASYDGDSNYASSTSAASYTVTVNNATITTMTASSSNIIAGNQITLTAIVDTNVKNPVPSNNLQFYGTRDGYYSGAVSYKTMTDANGNAEVQGTLVVTPLDNEQIWANFNGDANFASSSSFNAPVNVTVVTPDFSVSPTQLALTVTAGATASTPLTITPATNLSSQVTFQVLQAVNYAPGMNCSVTPNPVSLSAQQPTAASFSCSLPAPSSSTSSSVALSPEWRASMPGRNWLTLCGASFSLGLIFLILPSRLKIRRFSYCPFAVGLLGLIIGCGGGGSSLGGGGTPPPPQPTSTSVSLSVASVKVASGANLVTTVTVTGSQLPTGTVTILDSTTGIGLNTQPLLNGQVQIPVSFGGVGAHSLVAQYSGDAKNSASQTQNPLVVIVTGTTQGVFLTAGTGLDVKQINLSLTVQ